MFAVIKTGGKQYKVQEGDLLEVEKLHIEEGKKVTFTEVLLIEDGKNTLIGTPFVENAVVTGLVEENFKAKNVIVFKKKRRKQYKKKKGHRQELTRVKIEAIAAGLKGEATKKPQPAEKKEAVKKEKPEPAVTKEAEDKKGTKTAPAAKTTSEKKPVKKASPAKKTATKTASPEKPKTPAKKKSAAKPKETANKKGE